MKSFKNSGKRLLTRAEVAEIFHVSPSTITRWAEEGKLPAIKTLGGHRRYRAEVVQKLADQLTGKETSMEKTVIDVPAMYGDHHVVAVRQILLQLSGVAAVNASSCFKAVEVEYDPSQVSLDEMKAKLTAAGYLESLSIPVEAGVVAFQPGRSDQEILFRHTVAYQQTNQVVSFAQQVAYDGRPLWPCPGIGVLRDERPQEAAHD